MKSLIFTVLLLANSAFGSIGVLINTNGTTVQAATVPTACMPVSYGPFWGTNAVDGSITNVNGGGQTVSIYPDGKIVIGDGSGDGDFVFDPSGNFSLGGLSWDVPFGVSSISGITGNGPGLTSLNASQLTSGTVDNARLSSPLNISGGNSNWFGGSVTVDTNIISTYGQFKGNGAGLSNVVAVATNFTTYAVGTAYTMTGSSAALTFGTTQPVLTINQAGTYMIVGTVGIKYNGATYAAAQTMTFKLRRTNNTAADLTNGARTTELPVLTTFTGGDAVTLPHVIYTATSGDLVTIFGILSATPAAGSVLADSAELLALRIY